MLKILALFLFLVAVKSDDVLELTDETFDSLIAEHEVLLVMFYAPWCGHCKRLKPEFEKAASILQENDPPVVLSKIDCTEAGKDTCSKYGVSGYPTLKIFRNGEFSQEYQGPRETGGIVKYMKSQVGPSSKELTSDAAVQDFISKEDVAVIGFFAKDSKLKTPFLKLAEKMRENIRFGHSSTEDVMEKYEGDKLVLFRPKHLHSIFEPGKVEYDGKMDKGDMETWISKNYHGLCGHRTTDSATQFMQPLVVAYYDVDYVKNAKGTNYWRNRIMKVAQNFVDDFNFAVSAKDDFQHELNEFGLDYVPGDKPVITAKDVKGQKFVMKDEFSMDNLKKFLEDLKEANLEPYVKSESEPEDNSGPVTIATAKNFAQTVVDNNKDTLIKFYAPWCGHCKKLAPVFEELGTQMQGEDVAVVKMDATANDVPSPYDVRGFPTMYWAPKNQKDSPKRYEGGRELEDFIKYIAREATDELKQFDRKGKAKKGEL